MSHLVGQSRLAILFLIRCALMKIMNDVLNTFEGAIVARESCLPGRCCPPSLCPPGASHALGHLPSPGLRFLLWGGSGCPTQPHALPIAARCNAARRGQSGDARRPRKLKPSPATGPKSTMNSLTVSREVVARKPGQLSRSSPGPGRSFGNTLGT